jgi:hypothetical protein
MRCHICDKQLSDKEGAYNKDLQAREPCSYCLEIAMDAAYSDGYQYDEDYREVVVDADFDDSDSPWSYLPHTTHEHVDE